MDMIESRGNIDALIITKGVKKAKTTGKARPCTHQFVSMDMWKSSQIIGDGVIRTVRDKSQMGCEAVAIQVALGFLHFKALYVDDGRV